MVPIKIWLKSFSRLNRNFGRKQSINCLSKCVLKGAHAEAVNYTIHNQIDISTANINILSYTSTQ